MKISSRFSVAIHILTLLDINNDGKNTSEFIAGSVQTNPALIRKIIGMLKAAELVSVRPGVAGTNLTRPLSEITMLDVYRAVELDDKALFGVHNQPNPACVVGRNIQASIVPLFEDAQNALEQSLAATTLDQIVANVLANEEK